MTYLDENRQQAKLIEYRKELLANVSIFDRKDKKSCLMWVNQCAHTAINAKMSLKELLVAKAGPIVSTQVQTFLSRVPEATAMENQAAHPGMHFKCGNQNRSPPLSDKDDLG